jgi:serine/threonine protein kinase
MLAFTTFLEILTVQLAFLEDKPPENFVTPLGLRSPELILLNRINRAQDIWSFGCLIFEFLTGPIIVHSRHSHEQYRGSG